MATLLASLGMAIALAAVAGAFLWLAFNRRPFLRGADPSANRLAAKRQFMLYRGDFPQEQQSISGQSATVLSESESFVTPNFTVRGYTLTILAKSSSGQHFLFKSNSGGSPYIQLLSAEQASRYMHGASGASEA